MRDVFEIVDTTTEVSIRIIDSGTNEAHNKDTVG